MNLIKSTSTFSLFVLLSRVLGYIRDFFIAMYLGSGPLADAFFVAFRIPNTFRRLFSEGTFNAAFVPSYSSELLKGRRNANSFANTIFNLLLLGLFFTILIIEIFMPAFIKIIAPGFSNDTDKLNIAITLTRITFPFLFFVSLASFFSAILNSHNKFAAAAAAPIILNVLLIICLFYAENFNDNLVSYQKENNFELYDNTKKEANNLFEEKKNLIVNSLNNNKSDIIAKNKQIEELRKELENDAIQNGFDYEKAESDFIFLHFILNYLPVGLIGLIIAMIVNWFLQSAQLYYLISAAGVLIFVGLTAYDTQKIKNIYNSFDSNEESGKKAIMGALTLYLDFINLFIMLLRLIGQRR